MKVLWLTNIPSPYRVDFFNEFGKYCDLTVLFEKRASSDRDKSWERQNFVNFSGFVLNGKSTAADKAICPDVIKYLNKKKYAHIIITNIATPTGILAICYMKLLNIPYFIEGDGGFAKTGKGIKEVLKAHLIKGAKGYFSSAKSLDDYFIRYGADKNKIYRYPFTSVKEENIVNSLTDNIEKQNIKARLNITYKKVLLSVGQIIPRKGFDILINACVYLDKDIGIYVVGGRPNEEYNALMRNLQLTNVHFVEFITQDKLIEYYKIADLFVLPTREDIWGLVINEAMAFGLPIVTTDKCIAGLELVTDNSNGYLVGIEDPVMLSKKINHIFNDDSLREKMALRSKEIIQDYTIEKMAQSHLKTLKGIK